MKKIIQWIGVFFSVVIGIFVVVLFGKKTLFDEVDEMKGKHEQEKKDLEDNRKKSEEVRKQNEKAVDSMSRDELIDDILRNIGDKPDR